MENLDSREWLLTNGLGSFASSTVADARTRKYHGWLIAALNPPTQRTLLLSHLDASIESNGKKVELGTHFWGEGRVAPEGYKLLHSFDIHPVPTWVWKHENWQLTRQLVMPHGLEKTEKNVSLSSPNFCQRILIHYRYEGTEAINLTLRPFIGDRNFHHQQQKATGVSFRQHLQSQQLRLQAEWQEGLGTPWILRWSGGEYSVDGIWCENYHLPTEKRRGEGSQEDLYTPGYLVVTLQPGDGVTLEARVTDEQLSPLGVEEFEEAVKAEEDRLAGLFSHLNLPQSLLKASEQFVVHRASTNGPTIIAGYPWFSDWGRDTLIALPGLALTTQRFELARGLLETFGYYCRHGLIPNTFPDEEGEPIYNSIDASLWWIETLGLYVTATQNWAFLQKQYTVVEQIYNHFCQGTNYNIKVDPTDGLVSWNDPTVALTWMDAVVENNVMTARTGKNIEINALWYSALCWMISWGEHLSKDVRILKQQAQEVKASLQKFWNPDTGYLYDRIEPDGSFFPEIRPNAIIALSLTYCAFPIEQGQSVVNVARDRLLTPYGLRSLDPADSDYIATYTGDRWARDRAYHQGTVWSWLIGAFVRAWERFHPQQPLPFDWQPLLNHITQEGCIGSVSEIFDAESPYEAKGAIAQAWSVAEIIRHSVSNDKL